MRPVDEIIVHCTATRPEWNRHLSTAEKVAHVHDWHVKDRGWSDIGYHYLIDRDGTTLPGRPVERVGAHVAGHNTGSIGVALFGGHGSSETDKFSDHFTPQQENALRELLDELKVRFPAIKKISGHNEYAAKACPGFNVQAWQRVPRASVAQSTTVQASTGQIVAGAGTIGGAIAALDGTAQLVAIGIGGAVILFGMWIMRERLRRWAEGDR